MKRKIQKLKNIYHLFQAILANLWYGFPSRRLKMIGITGTDGKTTTTHLIYHILKTAEKKVSMISSVYAKINEKESDIGFHVTTPNPFVLQKLIKQAVDNKNEYFVLETTSHALDQNRVWGIKFEVSAITNITHEHLDYHQTYEEYVKAKAKLLLNSKLAVINGDDQSFNLIKNQISKIKYQKYNFKLKIFNKIPVLTLFNQYNYAAAYTVTKSLGINDKTILAAMKTFKLPKGRLEVVYDKNFKVIIDFAHTPNALDQVLNAVKESYLREKGRMIHVFGSAGLRDIAKRPMMGEASGRYADLVILTEEDYRTEDPLIITQQIAAGLQKQGFKPIDYNVLKHYSRKCFTVIIDRGEAIRKAIASVKKNDLVIITGKAHEKSLCRGKIEYRWDEKEAVKKALKIYNF